MAKGLEDDWGAAWGWGEKETRLLQVTCVLYFKNILLILCIELEYDMRTDLLCPRELKSMLGGWFPAAASFRSDAMHPVSPRAELLCVSGSREVGRDRGTRALYILVAGGLKIMKCKTLRNSAYPADLGVYALKSSAYK
jgi:hypothetical protein